jgi:UDP-glucose 4-epimerase
MNDLGPVLVTGGAGYLGSVLIRRLAAGAGMPGPVIRIFDNLQRGTVTGLMDLPLEGRYEFFEGDILDPHMTARALGGVRTVIHLAALAKTPFSFDHPHWTEHVNHWGTARLLEHCFEMGVQRFIYVSSASVYGNGGPYDEDDVCNPVGPYSQSKLRAEIAVRSAAERGMDVTVLRMATLFGHAPAGRFEAVPNRFAYLAAVGRPLILHGDGAQLRPVLHVRDACDAVQLCLEQPDLTRGTFNVVAENASISEIAEAVRSVRPLTPVRSTTQDIMSHFSLAIRGERFRALGWTPRLTIADGAAEIIEHLGRFQTQPKSASVLENIEV